MLNRKEVLDFIIAVFRWQFTINMNSVSIYGALLYYKIMIKNILFDLDGTLTDSRQGILGCFQHTVSELSGYTYSNDEIMAHVGIPLRTILGTLLVTNEEAMIENAVRVYREKFAEIGITGNTLYPGIQEMLSTLKGKGRKLYVVTMKNRFDAEKVIDYIGLTELFSGIYGPGLNGIPDNKRKLIEAALEENNLLPTETVMIGDREEDIKSGKATGTFTIAVTWGFGTREELIESAPDNFCESAGELLNVLSDLSL